MFATRGLLTNHESGTYKGHDAAICHERVVQRAYNLRGRKGKVGSHTWADRQMNIRPISAFSVHAFVDSLHAVEPLV